MSDEEYKKEYDAALAELDKSESKEDSIPASTEVKAEEAPKQEEVSTDDKSEEKTPDEVEELRKKLEIAEKRVKDTQAWGSKNAARLAELENERLLAQRSQNKPTILDANPELEDAIKYVTSDPAPEIERSKKDAEYLDIITTAHPDIFSEDLDKDLQDALEKRLTEIGDERLNPIVAIREITNIKLAFAEQQISKRFEVEAEKQKKKSAMSVPSQGGSVDRTPANKDLEEANRIVNMSDAEFAKEVKRVKGY